MTPDPQRAYVGRFAPSPTGPLHLGSLTTAVASFLHARQHGGEWLVRIEDIDPLRTIPGSADAILRTLEALALEWDRSVWFQSERSDAYRAAAHSLRERDLAYFCVCTRRQLRDEGAPGELGLHYSGTCRSLGLGDADAALRVRTDSPPCAFHDGLQGRIVVDIAAETGDYIVWRRDGVAAYHLAVVCDDAAQGVTNIVRGCDLLKASALHLHLGGLLGYEPPSYAHVPIVTNEYGEKLSKQHFIEPLEPAGADTLAWNIMTQLGATLPAELAQAPPAQIWEWALANWRLESLRGRASMTIDPRVNARIGGLRQA